jgi:alkyl sulfatase BDS1-like metallo-beta-lactamase superfamily hydrolase
MAKFGTVEVYEEMARLLNEDQAWLESGKALSANLVFHYRAPLDVTFFVRFEEGRVTDVKEIESPEAVNADYVLTADPDIWRGILDKKVTPITAVTVGKIKVKGNVRELMKMMKPFSRVLDTMTRIPLDN